MIEEKHLFKKPPVQLASDGSTGEEGNLRYGRTDGKGNAK
jgi:hypothetical protein